MTIEQASPYAWSQARKINSIQSIILILSILITTASTGLLASRFFQQLVNRIHLNWCKNGYYRGTTEIDAIADATYEATSV